MNTNRLLLLAGAIAAAAALVVVLLLLGRGSGTSGTSAVLEQTTTAVTPPRPLFAGIAQHGDTLGRASAPASLTVYEDPQCPFCREWALGTLPTVVARYVRTGRVRLVYHGIQIIGPNSEPGLRAIYAAGAQNKLWNMTDALYRRQGAENSGWITAAVIRAAAGAAGVNAARVLATSAAAAVTTALQAAARQSNTDRVQGTPTFVLQRPPALPQQLQLSALDAATFTAALDAALG